MSAKAVTGCEAVSAVERIVAWLEASAIRHGGGVVWPTSLGANLYDGTSGVALFLAESCAHGIEGAKELAIQGVQHAVECLGTIPSHFRLGLYLGIPGVLVALAVLPDEKGADGVASGTTCHRRRRHHVLDICGCARQLAASRAVTRRVGAWISVR
jgi:hypothetical protein